MGHYNPIPQAGLGSPFSISNFEEVIVEENGEVKVEKKELKETPKRVTKPKVVMSPEGIESRYQAFLAKTRGGK